MSQRPPDTKPEILRGDLSEGLLEAYLGGPDLAVDTETMGLQTLRDRLCVVQLCDRKGRASMVQITRDMLDPRKAPETRAPRLKRLSKTRASPRSSTSPASTWPRSATGSASDVEPLYCTRTVSKLVRTYTDRHGLKDNLLELLDVEMDKAARHTDWSSDTLSPEQVYYAISDVTLLLPLMDKLDAMLEREGRGQLARECFRAIPTFAQLDLMGFVDLLRALASRSSRPPSLLLLRRPVHRDHAHALVRSCAQGHVVRDDPADVRDELLVVAQIVPRKSVVRGR